MAARLRIKNFEQFQRYKDREPTWIMLHRTLLRDYEFAQLPDTAKSHLMLIWLLASQQPDHSVPDDAQWISSQIGAREPVDLEELVEAGWLIPAGQRPSQVSEPYRGPGSEHDLEDTLVERFQPGALFLDGSPVIEISRQMRIGESYLDIVVRTRDRVYVLELKRGRLSDKSLAQLRRYLALIPRAVGILIGYGTGPTFDFNTAADINVLAFDSAMNWQLLRNPSGLSEERIRDITGSSREITRDTVLDHSRAGARSVSVSESVSSSVSSSGEGEFEREGCAGEAQADEHSPRKREEAGSTPASSLEPALKASIANTQDFEEFWTAYPRKVAKQDALRAWRKLKPDAELRTRILADVRRFEASEPQFIPHPATYLNGKRWQDEPLPLSRAGPDAPRLTPTNAYLMQEWIKADELEKHGSQRDDTTAGAHTWPLVQAAGRRADDSSVAEPIRRTELQRLPGRTGPAG